MYTFIKDFSPEKGITFGAGVSFKGEIEKTEFTISVIGNNLLKNIPLDCVKYIEIKKKLRKKYNKIKKDTKKITKTI